MTRFKEPVKKIVFVALGRDIGFGRIYIERARVKEQYNLIKCNYIGFLKPLKQTKVIISIIGNRLCIILS